MPNRAIETAPAWVLYDGDCALCRGGAERFRGVLTRHGFKLATLQTPWVRVRFGLEAEKAPAEMLVLTPDGQAWGGADGIMQVARQIWWAWPMFLVSRVPGVMILFRAIYRQVAVRRHCLGGACTVPAQSHPSDWLLLVLLPILGFAAGKFLPSWAWMWLLAWTIFFGCKWLTWRRAVRRMGKVSVVRSAGYLFGWVGMDAKQFLRPDGFAPATHRRDWAEATLKFFTGVVLIWVVVRELVGAHPILAGWVGMVGCILCLHFGLFQLLALAWQRAGVNAQPLMEQPLRSASLADFWGRRWNSAFHRLADDLAFRPLLRWWGAPGAVLVVFGFSGLIHDLLISVPARGGYGLPTIYFLLQALGVIFERTNFARGIGLGRGWRGWLFTVAVTAGPAYLLFHPTFIRNVILPMLHAIGAT